MKSDDAVSEILGFVLVLGLVITLVSLVTAYALPNMIKTAEIEENEKALFVFEEIKRDMDTLCLADVSGMKRQYILDISDKALVSVSHGKKIGSTYREAKITYESKNILAEDVCIVIDSGGVSRNKKTILPSSFLLAVNPDDTPEQMEYGRKIRIEYSYLGRVSEGGEQCHLFSIRLL